MKEISVAKAILKYPGLAKGKIDPLVKMANKNEKCFAISGGGQRTIVLNDPDLIDYVLKENPDNFDRYKAIGLIGDFLKDGIFGKNGEEWMQHRKEMQPAFRPSMISDVWEEIHKSFEELISELHAKKESFDLENELKSFTFRLLFQTYIHSEIDYDPSHVVSLVDDLVEFCNPHNHSKRELKSAYKSLFGIEYKRAEMPASFYELKKIVSEIYDLAIKDEANQGVLLKSIIGNVDRQQVEGEICSLLIAGYDTVASSLSWICFEILKNPEYRDRIKQEGKEFDFSSNAFMRDMNFSKDFIYEVLRLYPAVPLLPRIVKEAVELKGVSLKKKDIIFISPFIYQRCQHHWKNPEQFLPERFKEIDGKFKSKYLIPFGTGKMTCVGNNLAISLMSIGVHLFAQKIDLEIVKNDYKPSFIVNTILKPTKAFKVLSISKVKQE